MEVERNYLRQLMRIAAGDIELACRISDVGRTRLYDLLKKHNIPARG